MHTPKKENWQMVIDNLKSVQHLSEREGCGLDMNETEVNQRWRLRENNFGKNTCGTIHCVGGWYAVAVLNPQDAITRISFSDGAHMMARHLGFVSVNKLEYWADDNVEIWGNKYGRNLFANISAYNGAETLAEIIIYLEGVRDRSPE
jgi:hypothetical protein